MPKEIICPKCKSNYVQIQFIETGSKTKMKHSGVGLGGHVHNAARGMLAIGTLGMSNLVIPKAKGQTKSVAKSKNEKVCICQNCGYSWKIK